MKFPTLELNRLSSFSEDSVDGIISIFGDFGAGKTTFALQSAINAAKEDKRVIYLYSKPNFPNEKVSNILKEEPNESHTDILDNIIFIQSTDFDDLSTIVFNLEFLILGNLKENDKLLNLIVIDSLTDLYRLELDKEKKSKNIENNLKLSQIMANLCYINETYSIEILVINEISRRNEEGKTVEVPAGGKVMNYWVSYLISIKRTEKLNVRKFELTKHPENLVLEFTADLTEKGFL